MKVYIAAHRADETEIFQKVNQKFGFELTFCADQLTQERVLELNGYEAVCVNAGCKVTPQMAEALKKAGIRYILTRTAGTDHLDLEAIHKEGLKAAYVPAYSPNAISEHTILLTLASLRKLKRQLKEIEEQYFFLNGLRGRELRTMTVGVIGTGRIGYQTIRGLSGFGCRILACDLYENNAVKEYASYVSQEQLLKEADLVVLHCPMTKENYHLINRGTIAQMKDGAVLVNTARGGLVDTEAVLEALTEEKLSAFAMDVYEYEGKTQRKDYRGKELDDPLLKKLLSMDQVIFTSHTAFYTDEAIENIIDTTLTNLHDWTADGHCENEI